MNDTIPTLTRAPELRAAQDGSYLTFLGCGGDLQEWVTGLSELFAAAGIGTPVKWYETTGAEVNEYATDLYGGPLRPDDRFPNDLTILMVPLDGLNVPVLALWRLQFPDAKWFDDIIANMRSIYA